MSESVAGTAAIGVKEFSCFFGQARYLKDINLDVRRNEILGIIGPAASGKSTFLRSLNRLNDLVPETRVEGTIEIDGKNIYAPDVSVVELRRRLGMVFATPVPLPRSVYENVIFGNRMAGMRKRRQLDELAEESLRQAGTLGRGLRSPSFECPQTLRRTAAAPLHRQDPGSPAGIYLAGRTDFRA